MMQKILYLAFVIIVSGLLGVNSLQCYVCNNCTNPTDADLITCGNPVISTPSTSTASSGATTGSAGATTSSSEATTIASVVTTESLDSNSTAPGTESTLGSDSEDPSPEGTRSKRSIPSHFKSSNSDGCNCRNEANCYCGDNLFSYRNSQFADDVPYVCYKVIEEDGIIYRGCGPATWPDGKALCQSEIAVNLTSCSTCDTDKCNGSFTMQFSIFLLAATTGILLFK